MYQVSQDYVEQINSYSREFLSEVKITQYTEQGEVVETYNNADIDYSCICTQNSGLAMGKTFSQQVKIKLYEPLRNIKSYNNTKIVVKSGLMVDGDIEWVSIGTFYANEVHTENNYTTIEITANDILYQLQEAYHTNITSLPTTDTEIVNDICEQYHIDIGDVETLDCTIDEIYEGTAFETIGYMAGLQGKNAFINRDNELQFKFYEEVIVEEDDITSDLLYKIRPEDYKEYGFQLKSEELTIESIISGTEETQYVAGNGNAVNFYNPYITQELVDSILDREQGKKYYVAEVDTFGNPALEIGDIVSIIGRTSNIYHIFLSRLDFQLHGGCSCLITSIGNTETDTEYSFTSPTEQKIKKVYDDIKLKIAEATSLISNSKGGIFQIIDSDNDGVNDGFIIADNQDITKANKVIVANKDGIAIGKEGINGTFQTAITGEEVIATELLIANARLSGYVNIIPGQLILGDVTQDTKLVAKNDKISFYNGDVASDDNEVAFFDNDSLEFKGGDRIKLGNFAIMRRNMGVISGKQQYNLSIVKVE